MSVTIGGPQQFSRWVRETVNDMHKFEVQMHKKIHLGVSKGVIRGTPVGDPSQWLSLRWHSAWSPGGGASAPTRNARSGPGKLPPSLSGYVGGRARGNWQSSTINPVAGETGRIDKGGFETLQANRAALSSLRPYSRSFLSNNVPYINRLNEGHSRQAPAGFVEGAIDRVALQFETGTLE